MKTSVPHVEAVGGAADGAAAEAVDGPAKEGITQPAEGRMLDLGGPDLDVTVSPSKNMPTCDVLRQSGERSIVVCASVRECEDQASIFRSMGVSAAGLHGVVDPVRLARLLDEHSNVQVLCCTIGQVEASVTFPTITWLWLLSSEGLKFVHTRRRFKLGTCTPYRTNLALPASLSSLSLMCVMTRPTE